MSRIRYERAPDVCMLIHHIITVCEMFPHVDPDRVYCVRSYNARTRAIARIYGTPGAWIAALGYNPGYVIEVVSEKYDTLDPLSKIKVLVHELLHIPSTFSGGLRPHGKNVNGRVVNTVISRMRSKGCLPELIDLASRRLLEA